MKFECKRLQCTTDLTVIAWYLQCLRPVLSNNFSWWPYCVTLLPIISPTFLYTFIREQVTWHKTHFTDTPLKRVQPSYIFDIILQGTYCTLQPVMTIKALQANDSFACHQCRWWHQRQHLPLSYWWPFQYTFCIRKSEIIPQLSH